MHNSIRCLVGLFYESKVTDLKINKNPVFYETRRESLVDVDVSGQFISFSDVLSRGY